jgi:arabinan endo-1,5-alpha-L-arabinosidase
MSVRQAEPYPLVRWLLVVALAIVAVPVRSVEALPPSATNKYDNPLEIVIPGGGFVESCADPDIIRGQQPGDTYWYMYCTTDPLNDEDRNASGGFNFHLIPMLRSANLVHWTYMGDAFTTRPGWIGDNTGMWAPEVAFFNGQYYLYYTAPDTDLPGGGSAIGVATSASPLGPWVDSGTPAVEPHAAPCCPGSRRWVFDPEVIEHNGQRYIYYGSYFGGISVRTLSTDGLHSDPASQVEVAIANRYEGAHIIQRDGYLYLLASATDCCRGPLTGYSVFAGRSTSPTGPFVDRDGNSLMAGRVGGTPVISMNGNRWVGLGHNAVFVDMAGQYWTVYHAIDRFDPYFEGAVGFTKRPVLLDPIDWVGGWPTVRGGLWASDSPEDGPAAQPGDQTGHQSKRVRDHSLGKDHPTLRDEFNGASLAPQWSWVREPATGTYGLGGGTFRFDTQAADLFEGSNNASVLAKDAPEGDYVVETRLRLNLPPEGCCFNYVQAGLVIYGNDDNFVKLVHVSIWETRQTEWAKELFPVPAGYPRYGNTVVGAPGEWTYLRIVKETRDGEEHYTAYTRPDGARWVRGGVWTHQLGEGAQIGLVAMGGSGFTANFDYVRVNTLNSD